VITHGLSAEGGIHGRNSGRLHLRKLSVKASIHARRCESSGEGRSYPGPRSRFGRLLVRWFDGCWGEGGRVSTYYYGKACAA